MPEIQFEESKYGNRQSFIPQKPGFGEKLVDFIIKISGGLIKDKKQASYVIIGLTVIFLIVSLFLLGNAFGVESEIPEDIKILPAEL